MKISVVLCCYNGEKYIRTQLESLKNQTRQPDEVLIIDDCSKDDTLEIVKEYIAEFGLVNWKVVENLKNKGWKENFISGMAKAEGEIIFPCDQDDIWNLQKIEKMSKVMEENSEILVLAANYSLYYEGTEYRKVSNIFTKDMKYDEKYSKVELNEKALYICRPGCVMAVRKELFEIARKYMFKDYPHDALFWRTALFLDGLYLYNFDAIKFRRHSTNASDAIRHAKQDKEADIKYYLKVTESLKRLTEENGNNNFKKELLCDIEKFWEKRLKFYETGKMRIFFELVFKYRKYYMANKALLGDLVICKFRRE